jgi:glycosyltransferase involved in cell wall biosynthesis
MTTLTYAVISPVRDEAENLRRLAACLVEQTVRPLAWAIVDNGSVDGTLEIARDLAQQHAWIRVLTVEAAPAAAPGAPIVRAFHAGFSASPKDAHVVVKQDADVSMAPDYFERILAAFGSDPKLGITGGSCYELRDGAWAETHVTGDHVRGASRCYRRTCLDAVLPLEERLGWDGIDELKAAIIGWKTGLVREAPFYHHRRVGERDGASTSRWVRQGAGAHYMGYRFSYLVLRSLHHALRRPAALAMIWGYLRAALERQPRCGDEAVRAYLRDQQRLSRLPLRLREAAGRRG